MAEPAQSYSNHRRFFPPFHFFLTPILLVNLILAARALMRAPSFATTWNVVMAVALITIALLARAMALRVQDRVIRLEMRLRLRELLPPDLRARIAELTPGQLVCLRFASDAELPDLTRQVLAGNLTSSTAIKKQVKTWQADWLRA